jgi:hypothetical protein
VTGARYGRRARFQALAFALGAAWVVVGPTGVMTASPVGASAVGDCPPHGRVVCVDRADGGHRVHVRVGRTLMVALNGSALRWSGLEQVGPMLLRPRGPVRHGGGGLSASYTAVKAGRTMLRATGAPHCSPGKPCPQFILLWQVQVVVG